MANETQATTQDVVAVVSTGPKATQWAATGRRKEATARVMLKPGNGRLIVNHRPMDDYFQRRSVWLEAIKAPLAITKTTGQFDVLAKARGGGLTGQADAVKLGIARALVLYDPALKSSLRHGGCLTRDPRAKERKKYGQKGARKKFQFSKR